MQIHIYEVDGFPFGGGVCDFKTPARLANVRRDKSGAGWLDLLEVEDGIAAAVGSARIINRYSIAIENRTQDYVDEVDVLEVQVGASGRKIVASSERIQTGDVLRIIAKHPRRMKKTLLH